MKTLIIKDSVLGTTARITALRTYQTKSGEWVAEVDGGEFRGVCKALCPGDDDYVCEDLHVEADQDDDGTEYRLSLNETE